MPRGLGSRLSIQQNRGLLGDFIGQQIANAMQYAQDVASGDVAMRGLERMLPGINRPFTPETVQQAMAQPYNPQAAQQAFSGLLGEMVPGPDLPVGGLLGQIAYHGSPHKFEKFDISKIGTGEGAQAYGHGLYFAENPRVAESYMNAGIGGIDWEKAKYGGKKIQSLYDSAQRKQDLAHRLNNRKMIDEANAELYYWESLLTGTHPYVVKSNALDPDYGWPEMTKFVNSIDDTKFKNINFPDTSLYKVDIPDEAISRMLDWDKPLSEQPESVQKALRSDPNINAAWDKLKSWTGGNFNRQWGGAYANEEIADTLKALGIPGIKYFDASSRSAGEGTRNFVLFDDSLVKILERNAQQLGLLGN